jgi:hypothetical protein
MGDWNRSTRECTLAGLPSAVRDAFQTHILSHSLGPILNDALICIETVSEKKKKGLFGGAGQVVTVSVIVTQHMLLWVVTEKTGSAALSLPLAGASVSDYAASPSYKLIADSGVEVTGMLTGSTSQEGILGSSVFIGLGEEPAAKKFKEILLAAAQKAKPGQS